MPPLTLVSERKDGRESTEPTCRVVFVAGSPLLSKLRGGGRVERIAFIHSNFHELVLGR